MNIRFLVFEAYISLKMHWLRTNLTILGMVIGISSLIITISAAKAVEDHIDNKVKSISNLLIILPQHSIKETLKISDSHAIVNINSIKAAAPIIYSKKNIISNNSNWKSSVLGTNTSYLQVLDWQLSYGVLFSKNDSINAKTLAIIGNTTKQKLFKNQNPLGKTIRIDHTPFTIIGVLEERGQSLDGRDRDNIVLIPFGTAKQRLFKSINKDSVDYILAATYKRQDIDLAKSQSNILLRSLHELSDNQEDDFKISEMKKAVSILKTITFLISSTMIFFAIISIIVGGIGITNMMLVSVAERTQEIGLRRAVGATNSAIIVQFLLESIFITIRSYLLAIIVSLSCILIMSSQLAITIFPTYFSLILAFTTALLVGIISGLIPAYNAIKIDPIKALRST